MSAESPRPRFRANASSAQGSRSGSSYQGNNGGVGRSSSKDGSSGDSQAFGNPSNSLQPQSASFAPPPVPASMNLSTSLTTSKSTIAPLSFSQNNNNLTYSTRASGFVANGDGNGAGGGVAGLNGVAQAGGFRIDYELKTGFSKERDGEEVYSLWAN